MHSIGAKRLSGEDAGLIHLRIRCNFLLLDGGGADMISAAVLGLLLASGPWERYKSDEIVVPAEAVWSFHSSSGDILHVMPGEIEMRSGSVVLWIHGYHRDNSKLKYRRSLTETSFDCKGTVYTLAFSSYGASNEQIDHWDGYHSSAVRPGTADAELQGKFCA
jgi:hypothetical protein